MDTPPQTVDQTAGKPAAAAWRAFVLTATATFAALMLACLLLVLAMNPYGNLPTGLFATHVIMDINQRYQYPAIVRAKTYDAIVIGTSTSRLLDPSALERAFGGRWANLAMNDSRAWEQVQLAQLFVRHTPRPHALLVGIDSVWCAPDADQNRITRRGFPEWMYDEDLLNDWLYVLNTTTVDVAVRQAVQRVGIFPPRVPHNGYEVFVPPDATYDAPKARDKIWQFVRERRIVPARQPYRLKPGEPGVWQTPALDWLEHLLGALPDTTLRLLALMPVHIAAQPRPGHKTEAVLAECKRRLAALADRHRAHLIDFMIPSEITTNDDNYWDNLHYRVGVAARIVDGLAVAVQAPVPAQTAADTPWRSLARPASGTGAPHNPGAPAMR
ncbi:MAG: hypothetical protein NW217_13805 [Hyphomicrobiaceae bacterium]|nr:hypothetical protein [Hyphomicrobiaceae bacterium]